MRSSSWPVQCLRAFQAEKTAKEFCKLIVRLSEQGLLLDEHQSVSEW
jgi:hypothetical protein